MPQAVHRVPRMRPGDSVGGSAVSRFDLPALPSLEPPARLQPVQLLIPVLGSLSILVYGVMARTAVLLVTGGIMALASLASPVVLHWSARRAQRAKLARRRQRFREQLAALDEAVEAARARLAAALAWPHPLPAQYASWIGSDQLWERRPDDDDLLAVRLGTADVPTGFTVSGAVAESVDAERDPEPEAEAEALAADAAVLREAPFALDLAEAGVVSIAGPRAPSVSLARAVVLELALTCAPDDLGLVVAVPPGALTAWEWAKWLPHTSSAARGPERRIATSTADVERHLTELVAPRLRLLEDGTWGASQEAFPRILVVVDRFDPFTEVGASPELTRAFERGPEVGVSVLAVVDDAGAAPSRTRAIVSMDADGQAVLRRARDASGVPFVPVAITAPDAEAVARSLAPKRLVADSVRSARATSGRLADLLPHGLFSGLQTGAPDEPLSSGGSYGWPEAGPRDLLRVPFAVCGDGGILELDLKESADGGHGPHGLVIGAVGSGKSELLRTLVAALAATHGPDDVELAFADFKGGLTFNLLNGLPHCSGMVTNLADDLSLVDRMKAALVGELERRQHLLRAAGEDVQRIGQYRALRRHRPELPAMPFLVVVVDEFGELLEARPDVLDVLLSIGRTGRSLGVHLVLAAQRLEVGRLRGLDSHLGFRICLRTFTPEDSTAVLGTRVAADLPALPGHGYLRTTNGLVRFLTATVSGRRDELDGRQAVRLFTASGVPRGVAGGGG
ncbi:MAG TPA: type VII secretion protein EccCa, partial [Kineosporiaceae bacterium]|nr:type VII secretion protein EccCa [Kineosporiaceae bacterium]